MFESGRRQRKLAEEGNRRAELCGDWRNPILHIVTVIHPRSGSVGLLLVLQIARKGWETRLRKFLQEGDLSITSGRQGIS
jgi:hypothetical protein